MSKYYLCGNTVKLLAEFYNIEGEPTDIELPKLIIYDYKYVKLQEITLTNANREGVGEYVYYYVTPPNPTRIIYEFKGEIDGLVALDRGEFSTKFVNKK